ncbi:MAG: hypothetical protein RJA22_2790 [Verrucomicrobiota bacterium]
MHLPPVAKGGLKKERWCAWQDLNLHGFRHYHLKVACLPIPPHAQRRRLLNQSPASGASGF